MGRFGQIMIYFGKKLGVLVGGVLTCIPHLPLFFSTRSKSGNSEHFR